MPAKVSAVFDREKLDKSDDYEGHLMVTLKGEDPDFERTPVRVVLVLDESGSMGGGTDSGQSKMEALKDTAARLIRNLTEKDEVAIVAFTTGVRVIQSIRKADDKEAIVGVINQLSPQMTTNMSGGLLQGLEQIGGKFDGVKRIFLLTDGLANQGVYSRDGLLDIVKQKDKDTSVSTFAFGTDADQELLADMASAGGGNFYYIKDGKDVSDVFARELGGIVSCIAQNVQVSVKPNNGNKVLDILNDFDVEDDYGTAKINLLDLYVDETRNLLIKMKITKPTGKAKPRGVSVAHIAVTYDDLKSKKKVTVELNPKVKFVKAADADKETKLEVAEQVALLESAKKQQEAVKKANAGDYVGAQAAYAVGVEALKGAEARGSELAEVACCFAVSHQPDFAEHRYNRNVSGLIGASAKGLRGARGTSGAAAQVYGTQHMAEMSRSFDKTGGLSEFHAGVPHIPSSQPTTPDVEPPVVVSSTGGYAKSRKTQR